MTAILCMLAGAGIGAGVVLILYVLGFGVELLNCACQILTCNCDGGDAIPWMWSGDSFGHVLLVQKSKTCPNESPLHIQGIASPPSQLQVRI